MVVGVAETHGAKRLCDRLTEATINGEMDSWDIYKASSEPKQAWDQRLIRSLFQAAVCQFSHSHISFW
ncbi:hypothetical protein V8E54_013328 [Elaphomyces granulatus]